MSDFTNIWEKVIIKNEKRIVYMIIDGLGGLAKEEGGLTELQTAKKPNLDALAYNSSLGLLEPVGPGITPGSGPGHLALFGYDPVLYFIGRGVLSALGVGFPLQKNDVAVRVNFATADQNGIILDRRAGRIDDQTNRNLCQLLSSKINLKAHNVDFFLLTEKEHRAVLILRGEDLCGEITDTDPQAIGVPPLKPQPLIPQAERTAKIADDFLTQARHILFDQPKANILLTRGYSMHPGFPTLSQRFQLNPLAMAIYPMYKGIARLLGMEVIEGLNSLFDQVRALRENFAQHDFFFFHHKATDSRGEDGDFFGKVKAIEQIDAIIPEILALKPDVLVITGDHSTPSSLKSHSWHPVPVLLHSPYARVDRISEFDELTCAKGSLGLRPMLHLLGLALAHAGKLTKFGA